MMPRKQLLVYVFWQALRGPNDIASRLERESRTSTYGNIGATIWYLVLRLNSKKQR
ncbi:hypothetical protein M407DRAFT_246655 [Tulasnella calospora MUT 4182]|uniref:Uncharacterized protein n=1 Tax=Tulasnella calospora MUT 4182 TaxID=1051891 RepID=A0A0C3Q4H0_9AGAM|nr:hypothetical protein M407DRAFT_246655 [Tulasnella calospora MUT 4182]